MSLRNSVVLYLISLFVLLLTPVKVETGQVFFLRQALEVKTSKNSPAYVAFEMSEKAFQEQTRIVAVNSQDIDLNNRSENKSEFFDRVLGKPLRLEAMIIHRDLEGPNRMVAGAEMPVANKGPQKISIKDNNVEGPLEFAGGLALTPAHHIEIERLQEGIPVESGTINVNDGTFSVDFPEKKGIIVARLVDANGVRIGEGRLDLEHLEDQAAQKLVIAPPAGFSPQVVTWNEHKPATQSWWGSFNPPPPKTSTPNDVGQTTCITNDCINPKPNTVQAMEVAANDRHFDSNSSTRALTTSKGNADTLFITMPGDNRLVVQMSNEMRNMIRAKVSEQRNFDLNDPNGAIIWGQVMADGKPLQGVQVVLEEDQSAEPVYFTETMEPQANATSTGPNGYFAFINVQEGFHTVRALRNFGTIAYDNVIAEMGKVSAARLQTTLQTHQVPVYVYDAFHGDAKSSEIQLQAFDENLKVTDGFSKVLLPKIRRQSYLFSTPEIGYMPAQYLYNDNADSIRVPLIKPEWLNYWVEQNKTDVDRTAATIVGFVPDEDFEVYLTGDHDETGEALIYFDADGKIVPAGVRGGGFAIFNLATKVQEVVVQGKTSQQQYIKVVPADAGSISIISFNN